MLLRTMKGGVLGYRLFLFLKIVNGKLRHTKLESEPWIPLLLRGENLSPLTILGENPLPQTPLEVHHSRELPSPVVWWSPGMLAFRAHRPDLFAHSGLEWAAWEVLISWLLKDRRCLVSTHIHKLVAGETDLQVVTKKSLLKKKRIKAWMLLQYYPNRP